MKVVILGCGRVGARIAKTLSSSHDVTVVDWSRSAFERLGSEFPGKVVQCNGIDVDCLRQAGVDGADIFFALTDNDNRNLMSAQIAQQRGVRQSVARVYDAERGKIFSEMGLSVVSPTIRGAQRLFDLVVGEREEA